MHPRKHMNQTHERAKVMAGKPEQPYTQEHTQELRQLQPQSYHKHSDMRHTKLQFLEVESHAG